MFSRITHVLRFAETSAKTNVSQLLTTTTARYHRNDRDAEYVATFQNLFNNNPGASRILSDFATTFHLEKLPKDTGEIIITTSPSPERATLHTSETEQSRHREGATSHRAVLEHNAKIMRMQNEDINRDQYTHTRFPAHPVVGSLKGNLQTMPSAYWRPSVFRSEENKLVLREGKSAWRGASRLGRRPEAEETIAKTAAVAPSVEAQRLKETRRPGKGRETETVDAWAEGNVSVMWDPSSSSR